MSPPLEMTLSVVSEHVLLQQLGGQFTVLDLITGVDADHGISGRMRLR